MDVLRGIRGRIMALKEEDRRVIVRNDLHSINVFHSLLPNITFWGVKEDLEGDFEKTVEVL